MLVALVMSERGANACLIMLSAKQDSHVLVPFLMPLVWCDWVSNPQPPASEADALPLEWQDSLHSCRVEIGNPREKEEG